MAAAGNRAIQQLHDMRAAIRWVPVGIVVVGALWLAIGFAVGEIAGVSEALPADILVALLPVERSSLEGELISICRWGPSGALGIQLVFLSLLFGGAPAAVLASILPALQPTNRDVWSAHWDKVFQAGFVFQLSSLAFTALLLLVVAWTAVEAGSLTKEAFAFGVFLLLSASCNAWGVGSWRALQGAVEQTSATISLRQSA